MFLLTSYDSWSCCRGFWAGHSRQRTCRLALEALRPVMSCSSSEVMKLVSRQCESWAVIGNELKPFGWQGWKHDLEFPCISHLLTILYVPEQRWITQASCFEEPSIVSQPKIENATRQSSGQRQRASLHATSNSDTRDRATTTSRHNGQKFGCIKKSGDYSLVRSLLC